MAPATTIKVQNISTTPEISLVPFSATPHPRATTYTVQIAVASDYFCLSLNFKYMESGSMYTLVLGFLCSA